MYSNWQGRIEQLSSGRFKGALRVVRGSMVRLLEIEGNQQVLLRGKDAADMFSVYTVTARNAGSIWQGRRLSPGHLVLIGTDVEVNHNSARTTQNLGITLRAADLEEAARVLLGDETAGLPRTWATFSPPAAAFSQLNRRLSSLLNLGTTDPMFPGSPDGRRLEQECVRSLVDSVLQFSLRAPTLSMTGRSLLIRRAEEFMRARLGNPVGAIDLCRELAVGDRTLRLAFRERFGIGPMVFYRRLRLNAAREMLKESPQAAIADVAHEFGFYHLGNFASDYRRLFGERPSQTDRSHPQRPAGWPDPPSSGRLR